MDKHTFTKLVERWLLPLFSDATIDRVIPARPRDPLSGASFDPHEHRVRPTKESNWQLCITRLQEFSKPDRKLFDKFMTEYTGMSQVLSSKFTDDFAPVLIARVVSSAMHPDNPAALQTVISGLVEWSSQTYEGSPIAVGVGFERKVGDRGVPIRDLWDQDALKTAADGYETILVCDGNGLLQRVDALPLPIDIDSAEEVPSQKAPYSFRRVAAWATSGRIAVSLTHNREILLFGNGELKFAWRRGAWHRISHGRILQLMGNAWDYPLRRAILETVLDVSFSRSGACIGLCTKTNLDTAFGDGRVLPARDRLLGGPESLKTAITRSLVGDNDFQDLPRSVRLHLVSIDGATVIAYDGSVLCAGAIVAVNQGSAAGSRRAAAISVSSLGLGLKVSADGPMTAFVGGVSTASFSAL